MNTSRLARPSVPDDLPSAERTFRDVNGVTLHAVAAGDPDDPLVVFLHGFPEFWYQWRAYIEPFVEAGYRVLVPDQRGYNRSDRPSGLAAYRLDELSRDVVELVATTTHETAHVVGHDWGAVVGWDLALRHPETVDRLGILNVPHPTVFEQTLASNPTQLRKSWYVLAVQIPRFPEWYLARNGFEPLLGKMRDTSLPGAFDERDLQQYRGAWAQPGALRAMLDWYRALVRYRETPPGRVVEAPTLVVWGENDQALVPEMAPESVEYCLDGRLERFPDATHWVPHERRERVSELLLEHLS